MLAVYPQHQDGYRYPEYDLVELAQEGNRYTEPDDEEMPIRKSLLFPPCPH